MNISKKSFISAVVILFLLLILAGLLTRILPQGAYEYTVVDGREQIVSGSFEYIEEAPLEIYNWFLAPFAVLLTDSGLVIIMIILFLLVIGGAIHILNEIKVLEALINQLIYRFRDNREILVYIITFVFMSLGAFVGIFEEVVPLIPLVILLSKQMGYDVMMGLGMSLLATGFGFAAAVSNPFTIGIAQKLAGLPMFSGFAFRALIFITTYVILNGFLKWYSRRFTDEYQVLAKKPEKHVALNFLSVCLTILLLLIVISPLVDVISALNLPIIALLFLIAGIGSSLITDRSTKETMTIFRTGLLSVLPAVLLILLATGIKHIIETGQIMDTILYRASILIEQSTDFQAILTVYVLVLMMNFFIGSGSAKAFIIIPLIAPLMDMHGISRQMAVLAFQFGDGFSNILYPTNAILLIGLGLANVSYIKWFKWIIGLQIIMTLLAIGFLALGLVIAY